MSGPLLDAERRPREIRDVLSSIARTVDELARASEDLLAAPSSGEPPVAPGPAPAASGERVDAELRAAAASLLVFAEHAEEAASAVTRARALGHRLRSAAANAELAGGGDAALRDEIERASREIDHVMESFVRALDGVPAAIHRSVMSFEALARQRVPAPPPALPERDAVLRRQTERAASELIALGKRLRTLVAGGPERQS